MWAMAYFFVSKSRHFSEYICVLQSPSVKESDISGVPEQKSFGTERVSERNSQIVRNKSKKQMRDFNDLVLNT